MSLGAAAAWVFSALVAIIHSQTLLCHLTPNAVAHGSFSFQDDEVGFSEVLIQGVEREIEEEAREEL